MPELTYLNFEETSRIVLLYLNGYTKWRCTKYKLSLTSSDISAKPRESRFQTSAKSNVKITV